MSILLVALFRLNGALISTADRLVADLGLTSARWQVLGVIANTTTPLPVASIARNMGLTRQAVRLVVNDLVSSDILTLQGNPRDQRASLVLLTPKGKALHRVALIRWKAWMRELRDITDTHQLDAATGVLQTLLEHLAAQPFRHPVRDA